MKRLALAPILLALACASCASCPSQAPQHRLVTHVVICWQKHPGDANERQALLSAAEPLRAIPGVVSVTAGTMLPSTRPIVDTTWDVAYVITFVNADAFNAYQTNPDHVKLRQQVLEPNVRQIKVYDLASQ